MFLRRSLMSRSSVCTLVCLAFIASGIARAQISTATLVGTVTDPSGGVVSGVTVQVTNKGTGVRRSATTGASGEYVIPNLSAAHYSITAKMAGFKTYTVPDIELQVAQRALVEIKMELGGVEQSVTVEATPALL